MNLISYSYKGYQLYLLYNQMWLPFGSGCFFKNISHCEIRENLTIENIL